MLPAYVGWPSEASETLPTYVGWLSEPSEGVYQWAVLPKPPKSPSLMLSFTNSG